MIFRVRGPKSLMKRWEDRQLEGQGRIIWQFFRPGMSLVDLGYIPEFLHMHDKRSAKEQIDANYTAGGGWRSFPGFKLGADNSLHYPGDPPIKPLAQCKLRDELIVFYRSSWVAIIQPDRSYDVARID